MAEKVKIKFWRGPESGRLGVTPDEGVPIWTTDNNELYIGDGATAGGILIGPGATLAANEDWGLVSEAVTESVERGLITEFVDDYANYHEGVG